MSVRTDPSHSPSSPDATASHLGCRVIARAEAMGLIPAVGRYDTDQLSRALTSLEAHAVGRQIQAPGADDSALRRWLEAVEHSPVPETEWGSMLGVLGEDLLVRLLGASSSSVRRYARRERRTPDHIAERLHVVALIVADLAGSYNDYGIRRWFGRRRTALEQRSPGDVLAASWSDHEASDEAGIEAVRRLASSLTAPLAS